MFGFLKKEQLPETPEITQSVDWTKDIKRSKKIGEEVEQLSFLYSSESNNETIGTKKGLSRDHLQILKKCKIESSALDLMKILMIAVLNFDLFDLFNIFIKSNALLSILHFFRI